MVKYVQVIINTLTNEPQIAREVESDTPPKAPADVVLKENEVWVIYEGTMPSLNLATLRWNDTIKELENDPTFKRPLTKAQEEYDTMKADIEATTSVMELQRVVIKLLGKRPEAGWQD